MGIVRHFPFSQKRIAIHPAFSFSTMRRLALHASALSDTEYDLYTAILRDIALADDDRSNGAPDDPHFENMNIGVREARAWLRGRYSHLPASTIDKVHFLGSHCILNAHSFSRFLNFSRPISVMTIQCLDLNFSRPYDWLYTLRVGRMLRGLWLSCKVRRRYYHRFVSLISNVLLADPGHTRPSSPAHNPRNPCWWHLWLRT